MNLATAIQLLTLYAGGPGSGCRGSNCGRPPGRYVMQQFKTPGGITVTTFKTVPGVQHRDAPVRNPVGSRTRAMDRRQHPMKGKFSRLEKHFGAGEARPGQKLRTWTSEAKQTAGEHAGNRGSVLFIHRYVDQQSGKPKSTVVDEHNWRDYRWRYSAPMRHEFKNSGRAAAFVKRRYGLSIPTKEYVS